MNNPKLSSREKWGLRKKPGDCKTKRNDKYKSTTDLENANKTNATMGTVHCETNKKNT